MTAMVTCVCLMAPADIIDFALERNGELGTERLYVTTTHHDLYRLRPDGEIDPHLRSGRHRRGAGRWVSLVSAKILIADTKRVELCGDKNAYLIATLAQLTQDGSYDPTFGGGDGITVLASQPDGCTPGESFSFTAPPTSRTAIRCATAIRTRASSRLAVRSPPGARDAGFGDRCALSFRRDPRRGFRRAGLRPSGRTGRGHCDHQCDPRDARVPGEVIVGGQRDVRTGDTLRTEVAVQRFLPDGTPDARYNGPDGYARRQIGPALLAGDGAISSGFARALLAGISRAANRERRGCRSKLSLERYRYQSGWSSAATLPSFPPPIFSRSRLSDVDISNPNLQTGTRYFAATTQGRAFLGPTVFAIRPNGRRDSTFGPTGMSTPPPLRPCGKATRGFRPLFSGTPEADVLRGAPNTFDALSGPDHVEVTSGAQPRLRRPRG